jgi:hypothetical protein
MDQVIATKKNKDSKLQTSSARALESGDGSCGVAVRQPITLDAALAHRSFADGQPERPLNLGQEYFGVVLRCSKPRTASRAQHTLLSVAVSYSRS